MSTDFEKLASDLMNGQPNQAFSDKSDALRQLAGSADAQKVKTLLGDGESVKKAMQSGDTAALQGIVKSILGTREGARLAEELARMFHSAGQ